MILQNGTAFDTLWCVTFRFNNNTKSSSCLQHITVTLPTGDTKPLIEYLILNCSKFILSGNVKFLNDSLFIIQHQRSV